MNVEYEISYRGLGRKILVQEPEECPRCKHSIKPSVLNLYLLDIVSYPISLYVTYLCRHCYKTFEGEFSVIINDSKIFGSNLISIVPNEFIPKCFDDCIASVSPTFIEIYNQSLKAELFHLDQIAGIGYRKALEFLIKDFLIVHEGKDDEKVKSTALGCCIDTMIDNVSLKTVASRATWLGNDQTHYEQKYTANDINDLKRLIDLAVHWISMIYLTDEAQSIEKK